MNNKISIKLLGQFSILYQDEHIFTELKGSHKTFEMFRFFLAQRERLFAAETVADFIWPENDYLEPKKVVRTYIHRLRKYMEDNVNTFSDTGSFFKIISEANGYKAVLGGQVELDTDQLLAICGEIQKEESCDGLLDCMDRLLKVYRGHFLEEYSSSGWVMRFRNQYIRSFCEGTRKVLQQLLDNGYIDEVINIGEKVLQKYELDETINLIYLEALYQKGHRKKALEHYSYITRKIYQELSIPPSEGMKKIYQKLNAPIKEVTEPGEAQVDDSALSLIVWDVMKDYIDPMQTQYAVAMIEVSNGGRKVVRGDKMVINALETALKRRLRKNDRFIVVNGNVAFAVLVNANEDSFAKITNRIKDIFYQNVDEPDMYTIDIQISLLKKVS